MCKNLQDLQILVELYLVFKKLFINKAISNDILLSLILMYSVLFQVYTTFPILYNMETGDVLFIVSANSSNDLQL